MAGVGIGAIQELLDHKSLAMTVRYSHLSPDFQQEAVDTLVPPEPASEAESEVIPELTPRRSRPRSHKPIACTKRLSFSDLHRTRP